MKHSTYILALIFILSMFFTVEDTVSAKSSTYEVNSTLLHVREEPAANASIVGLLHKGDKVSVFQEKYGWVQTYYSGKVAWVAKHHLISTASTNQETTVSHINPNKITVSASSVNIRSGPSLDHTVIAGTKAGETFSVIDRSGDWLKISLANGNSGWIAAWLTSGSTKQTSSKTQNVNTVAKTSTSQQTGNRSLAGYNIVLDAGHGGRDPGAIGIEGIHEKDLIASTTNKVANTLRAYGATVIETRTGDYYVSLDERIAISNTYHTHAFISLHYNAFPVMSVQGINTFYTSNEGHELARNVHTSLAAALPLNNRGIVPANYKVLRNTNAPAILLELGFLTNPYDLSVIRSPNHEQQVADAVANGLINHFH